MNFILNSILFTTLILASSCKHNLKSPDQGDSELQAINSNLIKCISEQTDSTCKKYKVNQQPSQPYFADAIDNIIKQYPDSLDTKVVKDTIGGSVKGDWITNTCAVRLSYALNFAYREEINPILYKAKPITLTAETTKAKNTTTPSNSDVEICDFAKDPNCGQIIENNIVNSPDTSGLNLNNVANKHAIPRCFKKGPCLYPYLRTEIGADKTFYALSVQEVAQYMIEKYGFPQHVIKLNDPEGITYGQVKDDANKLEELRVFKLNQLKEKFANVKGLILYNIPSGYSDANGHYDVWNGTENVYNNSTVAKASEVFLWL